MNHRTLGFVLAVGMTASAAASASEWKPDLMEREVEIREALDAGPASIRADAGVFVLTAGGYELAKDSHNGFHCIVGRSQPDAFEPQCFDAEGSETLLEVTLLRGELQMQGLSAEEIAQRMAEAWKSGRLNAPSRPGINYMLSTKNMVPVSADRVVAYGPHLMFYAPNLTDDDVGGDRTGQQSPIFMINAGQPSGYVIVPMFGHAGDDH